MAGAPQLKVFLAGRVAVQIDGVRVEEERFPGRQGRLLFAYLVAEQGRAVPRDELAEALWGERPPASWDKALTVLASKLRGLLAEQGVDGAGALTAAFGCYRLVLPEGTWVDVIAAASSAQQAQEALARGDLEDAKAAATWAASLAQQPFLPGDDDGAWVGRKRRELVDVRVRALSVLADASLRSGEPRDAAKWAEETIALEPFLESGYRSLMEAHAAAGNRAEALRVYERCRRLLADELGAYPSPETESIYRALLAAPQPSARATPPVAEPTVEPGEPELSHDQTEPPALRAKKATERPSRKRRAVLLAALGGVIAAAVVIPLVAFGEGGSGGRSAVSAAGDSLAVVDARSGRLVAATAVGATPTAVAAGEGAYWVANADRHTVSRIDPGTTAVVDTIPVGNGPSGIATGAGAVWVVNSLDGTVSRIDPGTNTVVQTIDVGGGPRGIVYAAGSVWVANTGDGTITRIDAEERQADQAAPGRRDRARLRRRHAVGEPACRGPGGSHRSDDREAGLRPDPRRERPDGDRLRPRRGVGGEQPGRDGVPDRSRDELRHRTRSHRQRDRCRGHRPTRHLGEQPVRRQGRADRSRQEPGGAASGRGRPPVGTGDVGRRRARRRPSLGRRPPRRDARAAD